MVQLISARLLKTLVSPWLPSWGETSLYRKYGILDNQLIMKNRPENLICEIKFGSHLYGTNTENSDEDFVGIYLPSTKDVLLNRVGKTLEQNSNKGKNGPGDIDVTYYSLHHFVKLAREGQTVAIDMLFAPPGLIYKSEQHAWIWDALVANRNKFLSKNMKSFIGYARNQAVKYSLKGSRLTKLKEFKAILDNYPLTALLNNAWKKLPKDAERINNNGINELQICGKWFGETTTVENVQKSVDNLLNKYGGRAQKAADDGGCDWKALSHALRVSKELTELLSFGSINFPLRSAPLLLKIKNGELSRDAVAELIDIELKYIEVLMAKSKLPDNVDGEFWDNWLFNTLMTEINYNA